MNDITLKETENGFEASICNKEEKLKNKPIFVTIVVKNRTKKKFNTSNIAKYEEKVLQVINYQYRSLIPSSLFSSHPVLVLPTERCYSDITLSGKERLQRKRDRMRYIDCSEFVYIMNKNNESLSHYAEEIITALKNGSIIIFDATKMRDSDLRWVSSIKSIIDLTPDSLKFRRQMPNEAIKDGKRYFY